MTRNTSNRTARTSLTLLALAAGACLMANVARATDRSPAPAGVQVQPDREVRDIRDVERCVTRLELVLRNVRRLVATQTVEDVSLLIDEAAISAEITALESEAGDALLAEIDTAAGLPDEVPQPAGPEVLDADDASPMIVCYAPVRQTRGTRLTSRIRSLAESFRELTDSAGRQPHRPTDSPDVSRLWEEAAAIQADIRDIAETLSAIEVQIADLSGLIAMHDEMVHSGARVVMDAAQLQSMVERLSAQIDGLWRDNESAFAAAGQLAIIAGEIDDVDLALEAQRLSNHSAATRRRLVHNMDSLSNIAEQLQRIGQRPDGTRR